MTLPEFDSLFVRVNPPPDANVPDFEELLDSICAAPSPLRSFAYPPEAPVCWIKYGRAVYWNEVCAQAMAYDGLRQIRSLVRVPAVFRAIEIYPMTYIVMEYIPGKTASQCLTESLEQGEKDIIYRSIALALSDLHRIPIDVGSRPAAASGGRIRHSVFDEQEAPRHYENVQQLEEHMNAFLELTKIKNVRFHDLAREPMVFCQSDLFHGNFMIDTDQRVTAIDFSDASILPSSFAKFAVADNRLGFDISPWVHIPVTEGVDNTQPLWALSGRIVIGSHSFAKLGRRMPGGDEETQERIERMVGRAPSEESDEDSGSEGTAT